MVMLITSNSKTNIVDFMKKVEFALHLFIIGERKVQGFTDKESFKRIIDEEYEKIQNSDINEM